MIERGYTRKGNFLFTLLAIGSGVQDSLIWESKDEIRLHILKEWKQHVAFVLQNLNKLQVKNAKITVYTDTVCNFFAEFHKILFRLEEETKRHARI